MQHVTKGRSVAGARVVPLMIEDEKLRQLESLVSGPVIEVLPLRSAKVGVVTTGSEVFMAAQIFAIDYRILRAFQQYLMAAYFCTASSHTSLNNDCIDMPLDKQHSKDSAAMSVVTTLIAYHFRCISIDISYGI